MDDIRHDAEWQDGIYVAIQDENLKENSPTDKIVRIYSDGGHCLIEMCGILIEESELDRIKNACGRVSALAYIKVEDYER